jgi:threonine/homoserine/homoserine lactone efflux protein
MFLAKNRGGGMGLQDWWMFVVMAFVVSATSVPNMLLVMSHGACHTLLRL